jgi:hypothetical protein
LRIMADFERLSIMKFKVIWKANIVEFLD